MCMQISSAAKHSSFAEMININLAQIAKGETPMVQGNIWCMVCRTIVDMQRAS